MQTAVSVAEMMELQQQMQEKMMKLISAGDQNGAQKAAEEMQKAMMAKIEKKCGPELKDEPLDPRSTSADFRMKEWITAYLSVRQEKDASTAARVVLASDAEAKLIESHLAALQQLAATEDKVNRSAH